MAEQNRKDNSSKVVLDKADLPLAQEEEEAPALPEEKGAEEDSDEPASPADESAAPLASKKRKLLIIAIGSGILLLLLAAVWWFFLRSPAPPEPPPQPEAHSEPSPVRSSVGPSGLALESFLIPLIPDSQGQGRLLRLNMILECRNTMERDQLLQNEKEILIVRDAIYRGLCNRSTTDINNARANGYLSDQIREHINQALGQEVIRQIYFPEFLFAG
jgi:flagellar FliL protein